MNTKLELKLLENAAKAIEKKIPFTAHILEPTEVIKNYNLMCILPGSSDTPDRTIIFSFMPGAAEVSEEISLLQFFSMLPLSAADHSVEGVKDILLYLSHRSPLGNFSLDEEKSVTMRYVYPVPRKRGLKTQEFVDVLSFFLAGMEMAMDHVGNYVKHSGVRQTSLQDT